MKKQITFLFAIIFTTSIFAQDIKLPEPVKTGGKPLMEALNNRKTTRDFDETKELSQQTLSNLLWAAWGYNRENKRTAPSSMNKQEMDIYVALKSGLYKWDAKENRLNLIFTEDIRKETGKQKFVGKAPVELILVADKAKMTADKDQEGILETAYADAGFISQNIYLFCASEGLATVVRGYVDKQALGKRMNIANSQMVVFSQSVGYEEKSAF